MIRQLAFALLAASALPQPHPLLLQNAVVYDGTGAKPRRADVRITADRITAIGHLKSAPKETTRDLHGLALAPGFIDMHSHADGGLLADLDAENMTLQGITTSLVGQDGGSQFPLAEFFARLKTTPPALNVASMAGFATLRQHVMGRDLFRPATPDEITKMKELLAQEMDAGAFGISTGLEYAPQHSAPTSEVIAVSMAAQRPGTFYISHVRDEANEAFESFREITQIGKETGLPVEITHIKLSATSVWHLAAKRMAQIFGAARRQHVDLRADVYPYTYWQSTIRVIVLDRDYFNPTKVAQAIADNGGADKIRLSTYEPDPSLAGKTLDQIARTWNVTPVDAYMRIVRETDPQPDGRRRAEGVIVTSMTEDDLRWFIAQPHIMFCTDGNLHGTHPRGAGSFPRVLGHYVRDEKVLPLALAIHKMTGLPAQALGLKDRGRIAPGFIADLVVFDPARVIDRATVEQPQAPPDGIESVMVSGEWIVDAGKVTGKHPGKVLRRPDTR